MFLSLFKAAAGEDRSVFGGFWFEPLGFRSATGARVTPDSALRMSAVWACVRVLSETMACMPFCMYRRRADGTRQRITDHPVQKLFNRAPNSMQTPFEWREMLQAHLVLRGNAYCQIVTDRKGTITELVPMHPDRVKVEMLKGGGYRYQFQQPDGTWMPLSRGEVWHLRGLSSDGISGINPIEQARDAVGMSLSAQEYGARFFNNDARPGGVIEFDGSFKSQADRQQFIESWQQAQSKANRGKTAVMEHGMKYKEIGLNNADAQFIEARKFQVTEIARMFRVPPHMIADLDRATFSNIEHQSLEFVLHTMTPWAERWESSIECNLLLDDEADIEVEFDFSSLLRGDHSARAAYYNSGINTGWLTRNEARVTEGYDPIAGLDVPLQPLNMVPAGTNVQDAVPEDSTPNRLPAPVPDARTVALAHAVAERVARKELQMARMTWRADDKPAALKAAYEQHAAFVASCLHVSKEEAEAYCADQFNNQPPPGTTEDEFFAVALSKLERLALKGTL